MSATTPTWLIPYPTGTDRVADGDNAMQALAERVDTLFTAEVGQSYKAVYLTVNTGIGWTGAAFGARSGGLVMISFVCYKSGWVGTEAFITNIPPHLRCVDIGQGIYGVGMETNTGTGTAFYASSIGSIHVAQDKPAGAGGIAGTITYTVK